MPMNGNDLGDAIMAAIDANAIPPVNRVTLFEAIGTAIVSYITANAAVAVAVPGVTTGPGVSGIGTGIIS